ncbi:hypothetical protein Thermo_00824 [Thermoplasmatales archaeon]|nr:hypothetical protein Thermo_00824 [Thermoplasmatales archaeon]
MDREIPLLTWELLDKAHIKFLEAEPRDAMYKVSTSLIEDYWGSDEEMSNALGVLLLTWNSAFYRYGKLDLDSIQNTLSKNMKVLNRFRSRDITTYQEHEKGEIEQLYGQFLVSLENTGKIGRKNEGKKTQSPVSVAKALHLLCPNFFPLWDDRIARGYGCKWRKSEESFNNYWEFLGLTANQVSKLGSDRNNDLQNAKLSTLKLVDEYNYVHFTLQRI